MGKLAVHTLGCKLNYAETSSVAQRFVEDGFELVKFSEEPDVVFINSCTVTENANRECRQIVRRALRSNPEACVIVTGCYAQLKPEEIGSIEGVDYVLGSREKFRVRELVPKFRKRETPLVHVGEFASNDTFGPAHTGSGDGRTRAFLKVQDGCDYKCSFCTIPLARGASRSQPLEEAVEAARRVVESGYREIVLTGVNTGDYGKKDGSSLVELLVRLHDVEGLGRLRISSIEPNLLNNEILDLAATSSIMVPHFHIPLQSGSDWLLGRMRRRYRTDEYRDLIWRIRSRMPACGIGVDVIVGFPGEEEEHFQETYRFLQEIDPSYLHVFSYSERENTPASRFDGTVDVHTRRERTKRLRTLSSKLAGQFAESQRNSIRSVLIEEGSGDHHLLGYTDNYVRVRVERSEGAVGGDILPMRVGAWDGAVAEAVLA